MRKFSVEFKSIVLCLSDGDHKHFKNSSRTISMPVPLLEVCISECNYHSDRCEFVEKQPEKNPYLMLSMVDLIDLYTNFQAFSPQLKKKDLRLSVYATYYNQISQAFEPFLEPWSLNVEINQKSESHSEDIKIYSPDFLNINVTYGMALNLLQVKSKIQEKLELIKKILETDKMRTEDYTKKPKKRVERMQSAVIVREGDLIPDLNDQFQVMNDDVFNTDLPLTSLI